MTNRRLDEIVDYLDKASLLADQLALTQNYAHSPFVLLAQQIDGAVAAAKAIQTRPQVALDQEHIMGFLHDGRLRTYDEIEDSLGHDPRDALSALYEDCRLSVTHAGGCTFYQRIP